VATCADRLRSLGWEVWIEVTFSEYGERGSIDLLGIHGATRIAVVVEVKTEIASVEETLRRLDVKGRLAPKLVFDRQGWRPTATGTVLLVLAGSTVRRRVVRHAAVFAAALPSRGRALRRWLPRPSGSTPGLLFLPSAKPIRPRQRTARSHPA